MPIKKICTKTKQIYREHKKPLLLVLAIAVLTGIAERFGENLFFKKQPDITTNTSNYYLPPKSSPQKITCPYCQNEIRFQYITTHTATPIARQTDNRER